MEKYKLTVVYGKTRALTTVEKHILLKYGCKKGHKILRKLWRIENGKVYEEVNDNG